MDAGHIGIYTLLRFRCFLEWPHFICLTICADPKDLTLSPRNSPVPLLKAPHAWRRIVDICGTAQKTVHEGLWKETWERFCQALDDRYGFPDNSMAALGSLEYTWSGLAACFPYCQHFHLSLLFRRDSLKDPCWGQESAGLLCAIWQFAEPSLVTYGPMPTDSPHRSPQRNKTKDKLCRADTHRQAPQKEKSIII